jgi:hypothetical protein
MNNTKLWMTAHNPSGFGMPMSGRAFGAVTPVTDARGIAATCVVRERLADIAGTTDAAKAGLGLAQSYFPGNSAWRPPTC